MRILVPLLLALLAGLGYLLFVEGDDTADPGGVAGPSVSARPGKPAARPALTTPPRQPEATPAKVVESARTDLLDPEPEVRAPSRRRPSLSGVLVGGAGMLGVEPEGCLVFEDSEAGIGSGLAANMRVVATSAANLPEGDSGHQDQSRAHRIVAGLEGIDAEFLRAVMQG